MSDEASGSSNGCSRASFLLVAGFRLVAIVAAAGTRMMWGVFDECFTELNEIRQCDVSCLQDIGHNLFSADGILTNHRENDRFWLRKRMWETCDMAMANSGGY